ncbi:MAG: hypothetical protein AB1716_07290 [Planctomycetota bacterium]
MSLRIAKPLLGAALAALYVVAAPPSRAQSEAARLPEPDNLSADLTVWPNRASWRNSDAWLVEHHDRIRMMRPRLLVLNFSNNRDMKWIRQRTEETIKALAESTRYHGFADPNAPAFLQYEVAKYVDLRDDPPPAGREKRSSAKYPRSDRPGHTLYAPFYSDAFAAYYGFKDPAQPGRFLNLHDLINAGLVHELWFYGVHDDETAAFESIEFKQYYDEQCRPIAGKHGPAGNGHPRDMPWSGRSFRITWYNTDRGLGCGMENFGHSLEAMANHNSIAYYKKYFDEFAEFDLDRRFPGCPFDKLYALGPDDKAEYPDATTLVLRLAPRDEPRERGGRGARGGRSERGGRSADSRPAAQSAPVAETQPADAPAPKVHTIKNYIAMGGNVHFPPGARGHYDLQSPFVVKTVIENWRQRNGPDGKDLVHDFDRTRFTQYDKLAPDCMGQWMIYWRQCMPGYGNKSVDDDGKPMKNWWVFLFY